MTHVIVEIQNIYACGRTSISTEQVRYPEPGESAEDWWDEVVAPLTGDGHPCGAYERSVYEATVAKADGALDLLGTTTSWEDS